MTSETFCLFVVGRLKGVTWQRLDDIIEAHGGRLIRKPSPKADLIALGHGSASSCLAEAPLLQLPEALSSTAQLISEDTLKQKLGLLPLPVEEPRTLNSADIVNATRLEMSVLRLLLLYDVLTPQDAAFSYDDLLAAREVARLLGDGFQLSAIVDAAHRLKAFGRSLATTRLDETPSGELGQIIGSGIGDIRGQLSLPLDAAHLSVDEAFDQAETFESAGALVDAERWYRIACRIDHFDPVLPFNLGNVLEVQGKFEEAMLAFRGAIARDPGFAEAWLNLGFAAERTDRLEEAELYYRGATKCRPDYADAVYSLALLLRRLRRYAEAGVYWKKFLSLHPSQEDATLARRMLRLCESDRCSSVV